MSWDTLWHRIDKLIDKQDMSHYIEPPGVGIAWLWKLPDTHPFFRPALRHDAEYDLVKAGASPYTSSAVPDLHFFQDCVTECAKLQTVASINWYLSEANTFYGLIRTWGAVRWPLLMHTAKTKTVDPAQAHAWQDTPGEDN